jgi:hypothetical protein
MNGHLVVVQAGGLGFLVPQLLDVVGQAQVPGHLVGGVVIAGNDENGNPGILQPGHLPHQEQPGLIVPPVAVIQIAANDHERDRTLNGCLDEVFEGLPGRTAHFFNRHSLILGEAPQWAVEMDVSHVEKSKHRV